MPHIIDAGSDRDRNSLKLSTKKGNHITNELRKEASPATLKAAQNLHKDQNPAARLRSSTATYNCMGMIFACRRTWVAPEFLSLCLRKILKDDEYKKLERRDNLSIGDLVVYSDASGEITHIGAIASISPNIMGKTKYETLSKWGRDGEYFHDIEDVPYFLGKPSEY